MIHDQKEIYPVHVMCAVLNVPRSTYYQSFNHTESHRERENKQLTEAIKQIHQESKSRYSAPKIHQSLLKKGLRTSLKRVQRLVGKEGILSITVTKFRPQSSNTTIMERTNHLEQDFTTNSLNQKWVADITYINTLKDGWCYLASVLDLHTKKIVGYSFSRTMTTELVLQALDNAVITQNPETGLKLHTDLGTQYTSEAFANAVNTYGIVQSFSRKGFPYDNASIESFHAILKKEEVHQVKYLDYESARLALFQYIERWYNRKRIHSQLGYRTPQEVDNDVCNSA